MESPVHPISHSDACHALLGFPLEDVVVFDTETTGLDNSTDEIISIAITNGYGKVLYRSYVRPKFHRSWPRAERVNHISPGMVMRAPTIDACAREIREHINSSHLIVGYNVPFDIRFLVNAGVIDWPDIVSWFDVMREFAKVHGTRRYGYDSYRYSKLEWCARYYGYRFHAHDSLEDAKATAHCLRSLLADRAYNRILIDGLAHEVSCLTTTQTKATKSNIDNLLGTFNSGNVDGELVLAAITRGKNRGKPRIECYVEGVCVGILTKAAESKYMRCEGIGKLQGPMPPLPIKANISSEGDVRRCFVTIDVSWLHDEIIYFDRRDRARSELLACLAKLARQKRRSALPKQSIAGESDTPLQTISKEAPSKGGAGCMTMLAQIVVIVTVFTIVLSVIGMGLYS